MSTNTTTKQNAIIEQAQELAYSIEARGAATFIRELLEQYHSHLFLAKAVLEGRIQEAKECAQADLDRFADTSFFMVQVAEVMERAEDIARALRRR